MRKLLWLFLSVAFTVSEKAYSQTTSVFDQHEVFNPEFYPYTGNSIRTASGRPGPEYWQNSADYVINVSLDDVNHSVSGSVIITYKNHSPETLPFLWLQLDQNIYNQASRAVATTAITGGRWANRNFNGGYTIKSVTL